MFILNNTITELNGSARSVSKKFSAILAPLFHTIDRQKNVSTILLIVNY